VSTNFEDFEIEITSNEKFEFFGKVLTSPGGESDRCRVKFPFANDPRDVEIQRLKLENALLRGDDRASSNIEQRRGRTSVPEQIIRDFGNALFRAIFVEPGPIRDVYSQSKGIVSRAQNTALRIKLRIGAPELASLPWEYLYDENDTPPYVSLKVPLVRHFEMAGSNQRMQVNGPLRILGMIANPSTPQWPRLDEPAERRRITQAIDQLQQDGRIQFEWVPGGTGPNLLTKLMEGEWHVFHFIGHGGFEESDGTSADDDNGYIILLDEYGAPVKKDSGDLAALLAPQQKSLRLAVLNCCESARTGPRGRIDSPAAALMRSGLRAVVAMQFPIGDRAAIRLAEGFYKALANNQPVDQAVTAARAFIRDGSRVEWGIPVLYMRSANAQLFEVNNPRLPMGGEAQNSLLDRFKLKHSAEGGLVDRRDFTSETDEKLLDLVLRMEVGATPLDELERLIALRQDLVDRRRPNPKLSSRLAEIYCEIGTRQQRQHEITKAIASFGYAIELDPSKPEYWIHRANLSVRVGLVEKALSDILEAIKLDPQKAEYYWIKGIVLSIAAGPDNNPGYIHEAIHAFDIAIGKNPREDKYRVSRANLLIRANRLLDAFTDIDFARSLNSE
jgi:CHAT domain-containing protein